MTDEIAHLFDADGRRCTTATTTDQLDQLKQLANRLGSDLTLSGTGAIHKLTIDEQHQTPDMRWKSTGLGPAVDQALAARETVYMMSLQHCLPPVTDGPVWLPGGALLYRERVGTTRLEHHVHGLLSGMAARLRQAQPLPDDVAALVNLAWVDELDNSHAGSIRDLARHLNDVVALGELPSAVHIAHGGRLVPVAWSLGYRPGGMHDEELLTVTVLAPDRTCTLSWSWAGQGYPALTKPRS